MSTVAAELKRLHGYASYVGCGCNGRPTKCKGEPNCAMADYLRGIRRLRDALRRAGTPGGGPR